MNKEPLLTILLSIILHGNDHLCKSSRENHLVSESHYRVINIPSSEVISKYQ